MVGIKEDIDVNDPKLKPYRQELKKVLRRIKKGSETAKTYGTGLAAESVIVATYDLMTIDQLTQLRYVLNQVIKKKRIYKSMNAQKNDTSDTR